MPYQIGPTTGTCVAARSHVSPRINPVPELYTHSAISRRKNSTARTELPAKSGHAEMSAPLKGATQHTLPTVAVEWRGDDSDAHDTRHDNVHEPCHARLPGHPHSGIPFPCHRPHAPALKTYDAEPVPHSRLFTRVIVHAAGEHERQRRVHDTRRHAGFTSGRADTTA